MKRLNSFEDFSKLIAGDTIYVFNNGEWRIYTFACFHPVKGRKGYIILVNYANFLLSTVFNIEHSQKFPFEHECYIGFDDYTANRICKAQLEHKIKNI